MSKNFIFFDKSETTVLLEQLKDEFVDCEFREFSCKDELIRIWTTARCDMRYFAVVSDSCHECFPNNTIAFNDVEHIIKAIHWILSNFNRDKNMNDKIWFCSDTHFNHANIIEYCNRPYHDITEMSETIIANWNNVVNKDDIVWHLGDFCLGPDQKKTIPQLVSRLNGKINLVLGNHDHHSIDFYYKSGFNRVYDRPVIINNFVILSHAPLEWVKDPMYNIFGHVHDNVLYKTWSKNGCCACVERHNYAPINWMTIKENYEKLTKEN